MALYALNRPGTVTYTVTNEDGIPTAPTAAPSVVVTDADGVTVATGTMTAGTGTGVYTYSLPSAVRGALGTYSVLLSYTVSGIASSTTVDVEVVGSLLFDVAELRDRYPDIANASSYPSADIRSARDEATARLEQAAGVAFASRRRLVTVSGDDTSRLMLPDVEVTAVHYVEVDDDAYSGSELAALTLDPSGMLVKTDGSVWPHGVRNVVVEYDHGYATTPEPVRRAAMRLAVEALIPSAMPTRAVAQTTDLGEIRYSLANPEAGRPTGDPEVDAVIAMFGRRRPNLG